VRRADRLFQIVQLLRGGRLVTAATLAEKLEVSVRTIYRDIADLQSTRVPIEGEAGVGYVMRDGYDIPPLMFTSDEIVALVAGAQMVRSWGGTAMANAAEEALIKIEAVLPEASRARAAGARVFALPSVQNQETRDRIDACEKSAENRDIISIEYTDLKGSASSRDIQPLGIWFWGNVWTLAAWCQLREGFRVFRVDRISKLTLTGERFAPVPDRSLAACLRHFEVEEFKRREKAGVAPNA
jgi:predicted DNA-binding transcriptional regulator YafY